MTNKFTYTKCLLCIRHLVYGGQSFLFGFGTDGHLLRWKLDDSNRQENEESIDEDRPAERIEGLHQSGINAVDIFYDSALSSKALIATVGDDTRLSLLELDLAADFSGQNEHKKLFRKDMAHASAIVGN